MGEEEKFESRVLANSLDVLAVINHLQDNLDKKPRIILTMKPRKGHESDYCSLKEPDVKKIQVEDEKEILSIGKFINQNLFMADIQVAIE